MTVSATFGSAILGRALADLNAGVYEDLGPNDGTRIREYLANFGLTPPEPWCAVSVGTWGKEASKETGIPSPVPWSASAIETGKQFQAAGLWVPVASAKDALVPGNVLVWTRGETRPCSLEACPLGCKGHIGVIESYSGGGTVNTIEGNSGPHGDRVARRVRPLDDTALLGVGVTSTGAQPVKPPPVSIPGPEKSPLWAFVVGAALGWGGVWALRGHRRR